MKRNSYKCFVLFICCFCVCNISISQELSFRYDKIRLAALIDSITVKSDIDVAYDVNAIPVDSLISVNYSNVHPFEILKEILNQDDVLVSYLNDQIIIGKSLRENKGDYLRINGRVVDNANNQALPMVNISIRNKAIGTITNNNGDFEFVVPMKYCNDTLVFSFLGYVNNFVPLVGADTLSEIRLTSHDIHLPEIEVKYQEVGEILNNVIHTKTQNYWEEQSLLTGFFRESILQDERYVQVSEAIVEIFKPDYDRLSSLERVRFIKGRKKKGLEKMENVDFKLEGGPFQFSRIDIARYMDFFPKEEDTYKYEYDGIDFKGDDLLYKVKFKPIDDDGSLLYTGTMFIHSKSYAVVHVDFSLTKRALRYSKKALIKRTSGKVKARPKQADYSVDYRFVNNKWILNKVTGLIVVNIVNKKHKINSDFKAVSELLISDCNVYREGRFKWSETFKESYVLADEIQETDVQFWGNYNIIKPNEAIEKVFKTELKLTEGKN